jgi:BlaI family penicillinase repressor
MTQQKPPPEILETEWDLLHALWNAERATAREVTESLADKRAWAYSTVKTMLDRMVEKGLVDARQVGNVWEYTPAMPRQEAQRWAWRRLATGRVAASVLQSSTMDNLRVEDCVVHAVRDWQFPPPAGGIVVVTYPYVFQPHD